MGHYGRMAISLSHLPPWRQLRNNGAALAAVGIIGTMLIALIDGELRWGNVGLISIVGSLLPLGAAAAKWSQERRGQQRTPRTRDQLGPYRKFAELAVSVPMYAGGAFLGLAIIIDIADVGRWPYLWLVGAGLMLLAFVFWLISQSGTSRERE